MAISFYTPFEKFRKICRPLIKVFVKSSKFSALRKLLVFLFCFQLIASSGAAALIARHSPSAITSDHLSEALHDTDLMLHIICEETNSEERIEKTLHAAFFVLEVFNKLSKFESVEVTWCVPHMLFDSSPPKYSLHKVFLI